MISAELQHAAIITGRTLIGRLQIEIVSKCQSRKGHLKKVELERVKSFVAHYGRIIYECGIGKCIRWRHG